MCERRAGAGRRRVIVSEKGTCSCCSLLPLLFLIRVFDDVVVFVAAFFHVTSYSRFHIYFFSSNVLYFVFSFVTNFLELPPFNSNVCFGIGIFFFLSVRWNWLDNRNINGQDYYGVGFVKKNVFYNMISFKKH